MAVSKRLTITFFFFYVVIIVYLVFFLFYLPFQEALIAFRSDLAGLTAGSNYYWALLISFGICFVGSASIAFPVPFPFVLFTLSASLMGNYATLDLATSSPTFWLAIFGLAIIGGLGCALGELIGYAVGYGTKKIIRDKSSNVVQNIDGFGKLVLNNQKRTPLYVFLFALTPLPDDIIFLPLGMIKYPAWKCIIPGWLGKSFTTIAYCLWPILFRMGILATGITDDSISSVVTESIMIIVTLTVMFFIMSFNWNKYLDNRKNNETNKSN
ncbi:MAG: VTT domain-containing protein [Promethearchaeota archaeon]